MARSSPATDFGVPSGLVGGSTHLRLQDTCHQGLLQELKVLLGAL